MNHFHSSKNIANNNEPIKSQLSSIPDKIQGVSVQILQNKKFVYNNKEFVSESVPLDNNSKNTKNILNKNSFDKNCGATEWCFQ